AGQVETGSPEQGGSLGVGRKGESLGLQTGEDEGVDGGAYALGVPGAGHGRPGQPLEGPELSVLLADARGCLPAGAGRRSRGQGEEGECQRGPAGEVRSDVAAVG